MQMKCRSVIEVRDGLTFLDLIVIQIEVILGSCFYFYLVSIFAPLVWTFRWWIHSTFMM